MRNKFFTFPILFLLTIANLNSAFAYCRGPGIESVGSFELVKTEVPQMKCRGDGGKLRVPGCLATLKKINAKAGEDSEFKTYLNPELCDGKVGAVREMKIRSACCDILFDVPCSSFPGGVFSDALSDSRTACNAGTSFYVVQYKSVKDGKAIVRRYSSQKKSFEDTDLKKILPSEKLPKAPPGQTPSILMKPFGKPQK